MTFYILYSVCGEKKRKKKYIMGEIYQIQCNGKVEQQALKMGAEI